ncbi:MAG: signal peptidase I [Thermoleophilia bacterium]|nr:signal peptidase I [Thermoleophilia bacterium]MDH5281234.1 signal peptidase I [Thermoleophilia bacterium]
MTRRTATRIASFVVIFAALAAAWAVLAPPELGGATRYVILDGNSMEPSLRTGDLAVIRRQESVEKGDIVLYNHPVLGAHVLHRVVRDRGGRYVLKGDNNDFLDGVRPTASEIEGQLWFSLPRVGSAIVWARQPLHAALIVFGLAFLALGGGAALSRTRRPTPTRGIAAAAPSEHRATSSPGTAAQVVLGIGLVGLAVFGLLAVASYTRSSTRAATTPDAYTHVGKFSYGAPVEESDVYPDGVVDTGESVFLQLVPALDLAFDYRLESKQAADARGAVELTAVLSDSAGWVRRIPLGETIGFDGTTARATGSLDLVALGDIVEEMRALTGSGTTTFALGIVAGVELRGRVGDEPVRQTFSPKLPFLLDTVSLRPNTSAEDSAIFSARRGETITVRSPSSLSIGRLRLSVENARRLALLGLVFAALIAAAGVALLWRARSGGEPTQIASLFGDRMITISGLPATESESVTELTDAGSLYRIAEHYDRIVLHWREGRKHVYQVDDGASVYRYCVGIGLEPESAHEIGDEEDTLALSPAKLPPRAAAS